MKNIIIKVKIIFLLISLIGTFTIFAETQTENQTLLIIKQNDFGSIRTIIENVRNELVKSHPTLKIQEITFNGEDDTITTINKTNPNIILLVGTDIAKTLIDHTKNIPIVISDMFKPGYASTFPADRCIVNSLYIPTQTRMAYTKKILPDSKVIGIIYNPIKNSDVVEDAQIYAQSHGMTIKKFPVNDEKDIQAIDKLKTDALLLIPDSLVCSVISLKHIIGQCVAERIPIIGIAEYFAQTGTVVAISIDFTAYSKQVAASINALVDKKPILSIPSTFPESIDYFINAAMAKAKNVKIKDEILRDAKKVFGQ